MQTHTARELFERFRVPVAPNSDHHVRAGWLNTCCPYCGVGSNKYHLGWNLRFGHFNCWQCGKQDTAKTMSLLFRIPFSEAVELKKTLRLSLPLELPSRPTGTYQIPNGVGSVTEHHRNYLKNVRRLDPDQVIQTWNLQGIGFVGNGLQWRLFIPIYYKNKPVSWTTRAIRKSDTLRYRSAAPEQELIPHKHLLYGEQYASYTTIIVHEGPIDVWTTGPGAVCTFGTNWTPQQFNRIASYPRRVICFDNEYQAQLQAEKLAMDLSVYPGETFNVCLQTGKDSNSAAKNEIRQLRETFGLHF